MRTRILDELYANKENYISGQVLARNLGVSRTAIWKHINILKQEGYNIETVSGRGYRLLDMEDKLLPREIEGLLFNNTIGRPVIYFESIDSTNNYAKKEIKNLPHGTIILGEEQVEGKGRRGRYWASPKETGIWVSIVLKPKIPPKEGIKMTQVAAAAICKSIREITGLDALIKWPNDIVINGKKVCGILTEMAGELNEINYIIIGIGINVNVEEFSGEVGESATSLSIEGGKKLDRRQLLVHILRNFEVLYNSYIENLDLHASLYIVRKYSALLGKNIKIVQGKLEKKAKAINIDDEGLLLVELEDGSKELIAVGEVSIRGEKGYV